MVHYTKLTILIDAFLWLEIVKPRLKSLVLFPAAATAVGKLKVLLCSVEQNNVFCGVMAFLKICTGCLKSQNTDVFLGIS